MHRGMKDENYSLHPYDCEKKKKRKERNLVVILERTEVIMNNILEMWSYAKSKLGFFFFGGRDQLYKSIRFEIRALFD